jgi:hypothetical protein
MRHLLAEQGVDCRSLGNVEMTGEAAAVAVDK